MTATPERVPPGRVATIQVSCLDRTLEDCDGRVGFREYGPTGGTLLEQTIDAVVPTPEGPVVVTYVMEVPVPPAVSDGVVEVTAGSAHSAAAGPTS